MILELDNTLRQRRMLLLNFLIVLTMVTVCNGNPSASKTMDCKPCQCKTSRRGGGIIAVCKGLKLTSVPDSIPNVIEVLLLNNNAFKHLSEGMFKKFSLLERLDLSSCHLASLDGSSFVGLANLKILILADNKLRLNNHTYPHGLFRNLNLEVLDISKNDNTGNKDSNYNIGAFFHLVSLKKLLVDGLKKSSFGEVFEGLKNLTFLSLSGARGYCSIKHLTNSSFKHLSRLRHLNLSYCEILDIDIDTFGSLRFIETLDISYNKYLGFETLGKALYGLRNSSLKVLDISYIVNYLKIVHLQVKHLKYLNQTKLEVLLINGNGIQTVDSYVPTLFPSLTHLYCRSNRFMSGVYIFGLDPMINLQYIDLSHGNPQQTLPFLNPSGKIRSVTSTKNMKSSQRDVANPLETFTWNPKLMLPMPQNLRSINYSYCYITGRIDEMPVSPNNVTSIDLSFNLFQSLTASSPYTDKMVFLDFSHNYVSNLTADFLKFGTELRVLNFSYNYLEKSFRADKEGSTFIHNTRLKILRIAANSIQNLPERLFQSLHELELLDVSENELSIWKPKIRHMTNLSFLDISGNRLEEIPWNLRKDINVITKGRVWPLRLVISGNNFMCDCSHLQYLHWLKTVDINITDLSSAKCKFWNGEMINMDPLEDLLMALHQHCHVITPLIFGTVGGIIIFLIILISGIVYRYRWKLRYLYYTTKRKHRGYQRIADEDEDTFVYDAFISYADEDRAFVMDEMRHILEDTFGLKLCIHHRDFMVGQNICENIINSIQTSRKTIVIMSPDFVKSAWCDYEVHMAKLEGIHSGRDVICVVVYEDVPDRSKMSSDLLHEIAHGTYIEYPEDLEGKDHFWNCLKDAITLRN